MKTKTITKHRNNNNRSQSSSSSRYYHRVHRPATNRDYYQRMGSVIQAVEQSKTKPVSTWRLTYSARLTWHTLLALLDEMLDYGFISLVDAQTVHRKRGPRRFGEVGLINTPSARFIETTAKGRKFLAITQAMATLMPTAPWLADD